MNVIALPSAVLIWSTERVVGADSIAMKSEP